ncbi:MAG: S8 family serine peptidase [Bdellovibrionaceae bacterium]|mgnify:CR=1 FL=1|jgi:subtilisin family serine protease|nr:S8 family serine peptidase [Pseudobdellovibrionaceae bacterium]
MRISIALCILLSQICLASEVCHESVSQGGSRLSSCSQNNRLIITDYFQDGIHPSKIQTFDNGTLSREDSYSITGDLTTRTDYDYELDGSYFKSYFQSNFTFEDRKEKFHIINDQEILLENYGFNSKTHELENIDIYDEGLVVTRKVIKYNRYAFHYNFIYDNQRVIGFESFVEHKKIGDYSQTSVQQLPNNPSDIRVKIAILDSGFDHEHPLVRDSIYLNEDDPIDGLDNDQDGFIDNYLGTYFNEYGDLKFSTGITEFKQSELVKKKYFSIPFETIDLTKTGIIDSHGTHVASLALNNTSHTILYPFAGDYGSSTYLDKISKKIKTDKVDFVNMSFSFPHMATRDVDRKTYTSLKKLITSNPETVFFVAAGNDGNELQHNRFHCLYPACYKYQNLVTVGATSDSYWRSDNNYQMADYSNYSSNFVHLFAPGTQVKGALIGDMEVQYTGTSMATPMAMNIAIKLKEEFPQLSALEIKDAMFKTAISNDNIKAKYGVIDYKKSREQLLEH